MSKARARHILVEQEAQAQELKGRIENGEDFAALAKQHSQCPSASEGGDLGEFPRGVMVAEFDQVVFSAEVGQVQGPVKTQFGYHLILVEERKN